jgi:hypothetical protein
VALAVHSASTYDDFTAGTLDSSRWSVLELPQRSGRTWRCEDPSARTEVGEGTLDIHVEHFTRGHDRDGQAGCTILDPRTGWSFRTFTASHDIFAIHGGMWADSSTSPSSIITTLQPILEGRSQSSRGQGLPASFGPTAISVPA